MEKVAAERIMGAGKEKGKTLKRVKRELSGEKDENRTGNTVPAEIEISRQKSERQVQEAQVRAEQRGALGNKKQQSE